jgi:hypothetical protein
MKIENTSVLMGSRANIKQQDSTRTVDADTKKSAHIVILPAALGRFAPIEVTNESINSLEGCFTASLPLQTAISTNLYSGIIEGTIAFSGAEIVRPESINFNIPLLEETVTVAKLCEQAVARAIDFESFTNSLNSINFLGATKEQIIEAMFESSQAASPLSQTETIRSSDASLDAILSQVNINRSISTPAQNFIESVSGSATGYRLKEEQSRLLIKRFQEFIVTCENTIHNLYEVEQFTSWCTSLNRLIKKSKARNKQSIILISENLLTSEFNSLAKLLEEYSDALSSMLILDTIKLPELEIICSSAAALCGKFNLPLFIQPEDNTIIESLSFTRSLDQAEQIYLFSGKIASLLSSKEIHSPLIWKNASTAFLEGTIINAEKGWTFENSLLKLKDQDVFIENNRSRSTEKILTSEEWNDLYSMRINAANSIRNSDIVMFMKPVAAR